MAEDRNKIAEIDDENHIVAERRAKVQKWRAETTAYPNDFVRKDCFADIRAAYADKAPEEIEALSPEVSVSGRMMLKRIMGKASFATVRDGSGVMQYFLSKQEMGEKAYAEFKMMDIGDIIAATGVVFKTHRGELSIRVKTLKLLSKAIRPLPEKFKGLSDQEMCYRQRYLDLIMNETSRNRFIIRSKVIDAIRSYMKANGFMEVETPMLHPIPGGANAKPFITHHNALDQQMYLRIAPELYLKRLVVGGFERVFELNRCFRNEGVDVRHNPEFTTIEFYAAYWTYVDQMNFTEALLREVTVETTGSSKVVYQGREIDFGKPFDRLSPKDAILKYLPEYTEENLADKEFLLRELEKLGAPKPANSSLGVLIMGLFDEKCESKLINPTFLVEYPKEISPLARSNDQNPELCDRFELFIGGREAANGFSELNDPEDQAARFREQAEAKANGDDEAMYYDADYVRALEYGLPPTAGCGIGIDRFVMLLTDAPSIRDVLLFPTMRPENL